MSSLLLQAPTILLILFCSLSPLASQATTDVLDDWGNPVEAGYPYHILPQIEGFGGGLILSRKNDSELCPLYVIQDKREDSIGDPVIFYPRNSEQGFVSTSSNLKIDFNRLNLCRESTVWRLTADEPTGRLYVGVDGDISDSEAISDWFKIEKVGEYDYKIVYCPKELSSEVVCGDLGIFVEGDKRILGLTDKPFLVWFTRDF